MQRAIKPSNARSKRALQAREPKIIEDPKIAIFVKSTQTSEKVRTALTELLKLRSSSHSIQFAKRNLIHPFEDSTSLQFWSIKNDAGLFLIGSDSKKRPDNLTFVRMFDHQVLDMMEVGIEGAISLADIRGPKTTSGLIPLFHFAGTLWDSHERYKQFKSIILDFFKGQDMHSIDLVHGLQHVISVSAGEIDQPGTTDSLLNRGLAVIPTQTETVEPTTECPPPVSLVDSNQAAASGKTEGLPLIHFRTYIIQLVKSGQHEPRVELIDHGPSFDFRLRRTQAAQEDLLKQALQRHLPKKPTGENKKSKANKNVDIDEMGDKVGKIHMNQQELSKLQSRKMKGLKKEKPNKKKSVLKNNDKDDDGTASGDEVEMNDGNGEADEMGAIMELDQQKVNH